MKLEIRCKDTTIFWNICNKLQTFCKKSSFLKYISNFCLVLIQESQYVKDRIYFVGVARINHFSACGHLSPQNVL